MKISRYVGFLVLILSLSGTQAIEAFSLKPERTEPSRTVRKVSVNSIVQAPRDTNVQTEDKSSSYQLPDDLPNVFINQELIDAAKKRLSQSPQEYPLTHKAYKNIQNTARTFYQQSSSQLPIYFGTNPDEYRPLVEKNLAKTLHLAVVCAIENKQDYCKRAADIILAWAREESGTRLGNGNDSYLIGTGLDISRLFYSYAQAFSMVSSSLSNAEKKMIENWFLYLGKKVKKSHQYWLRNLEIEGANNHLSWHNQGMLIAALYGGDRSLLSYIMDGNRWSYRNLVRDAIYEQNNPDNLFRADRDFAHLPIQVRTGEVYDRHRSLPHHPAREDIYNREKWWNQKVRQRAGFAYSMFHLEALVLTAHIAQLNDISYSGGKSFMNIYNKSIRSALRFYGKYYIDYPSSRSDCQSISDLAISPEPYIGKCPISYEPYFGERPAYHKTHVFAIAQKYYPEDRSFYKKIILENQKDLIPDRVPPPHGPINVFTFFFAEG